MAPAALARKCVAAAMMPQSPLGDIASLGYVPEVSEVDLAFLGGDAVAVSDTPEFLWRNGPIFTNGPHTSRSLGLLEAATYVAADLALGSGGLRGDWKGP